LLLRDYQWAKAEPVKSQGGSDLGEAESIELIVRRLGLQDYLPIWKSMRYRAHHAKVGDPDEIWLLSHKPVYTLGQAGDSSHILNAADIPVHHIDRGGQVTYHGPGQLIAYLLLGMKRRRLGVRSLVDVIEQALIATLDHFGIKGQTRAGAPGIYVNDAKIAALGLRIKNGRSYHGLSLNVNMDLSPFNNINPCGFAELEVTRMADLVVNQDQLMSRVSRVLANELVAQLGYAPIYTNPTQAIDS